MKNLPSTLKDYYKSMKDAISAKKEDVTNNIIASKETLNELYNIVNANAEAYKSLGISISNYSEYVNKEYIDGTFLRKIKSVFNNNKDNLDVVNLLSYAELQYKINKLEDVERHYERMLNLSYFEYKDLIYAFYTKVHEYMVVKGFGYVLENPIGWLCINRCKLNNPKPHIDYAATKKRKAELIEQGIRVYNKEEAEWCAKNGIEYNAEDGRVFRNDEYCYEILLLGCRLDDGSKYSFQSTDYRHNKLRGKTNDELAESCNNDINKICKLPVDLRTKLNMAVKADNTLYLNFIRNENQKPLADSKVNRKNRQRL